MMRMPTFAQFSQQALNISKQYDSLNTYQAQIFSGKRIVNSSDDPVLAAQIKSTEDFMAQVESYRNNCAVAQGRSSMFSDTTRGALAKLTDAQSILQKALNGTMQDSDRVNLAKQLQGDLQTLLNLANTQDVNGEYIYGGYNSSSAPFIVSGNNNYSYQGSYDAALIDIGQGMTSVFNESGYNVFGNIYTGNGMFTVTAANTNAGSATTSAGSVTNPGSYVPDNYTINFVTNSAGQLAYTVVGATSGQVIPPPPAQIPQNAPAYTPGTTGMDINFNGLTVNINGAAKVGDNFQIQPSTQQNAFNTLQNAINLLQSSSTNKGVYNQSLQQASASITQIINHMTAYQSTVGANSGIIQDQIKINKKTLDNETITLGSLQDVDITDAISKLSQQSVALQATQMSYAKIQEIFSQILKL